MRFSIFIPVYNIDQMLLGQCMSSILEEKKVSYEIIIVDDGSNINCISV